MFVKVIRRASYCFLYIYLVFTLKGIPHLISMHDVSKENVKNRVGQRMCALAD